MDSDRTVTANQDIRHSRMLLAEAQFPGLRSALRIAGPDQTTVRTSASGLGCSLTPRLAVKPSMMRLPGSLFSPRVGLCLLRDGGRGRWRVNGENALASSMQITGMPRRHWLHPPPRGAAWPAESFVGGRSPPARGPREGPERDRRSLPQAPGPGPEGRRRPALHDRAGDRPDRAPTLGRHPATPWRAGGRVRRW